jgi:hypothetical protein
MPRWASRITLEVTDIRVERLQSISEGDATKEGVPLHNDMRWAFHMTWDGIYSKQGFCWKVNPWVWVVEFKKI